MSISYPILNWILMIFLQFAPLTELKTNDTIVYTNGQRSENFISFEVVTKSHVGGEPHLKIRSRFLADVPSRQILTAHLVYRKNQWYLVSLTENDRRNLKDNKKIPIRYPKNSLLIDIDQDPLTRTSDSVESIYPDVSGRQTKKIVCNEMRFGGSKFSVHILANNDFGLLEAKLQSKQGLGLGIKLSPTSLAQYGGLARHDKGIKVVIKDSSGRKVGLYKGSHALLIGVSDYTAGWPKLEMVPDEIDQVEASLKSQGFHVLKVMNPTSDQLSEAFEGFIDQYGFDENNRLLFFFSGHGHSRKGGRKGYLVPTDAPDPRYDEKGFARKAIGMGQILAWSREIEAKHALFLFDSCFSGTVFKAKALPKIPPHISDVTSRPVRQFVSAGSAGEEVPARSVFTPSFIRALGGEGDLDRDGYVTGTELGMYLHRKVLSYDTGQTPQYGKIKDPDLDEGDFVFALKTHSQPLPKYDRLQEGRKRLEQERREIERLKAEIEHKKLKTERKRLEAELEKQVQTKPSTRQPPTPKDVAVIERKLKREEQVLQRLNLYLVSRKHTLDERQLAEINSKISAQAKSVAYLSAQLDSGKRQEKKTDEIARDRTYIAYASGIVRDTKTGLEWKAGPDKDMNWNQARLWVQRSRNLDGGGWRMPTMDELASLYREGTGSRSMTPLLKTTGRYVWSGETTGSSEAGAFSFDFGGGVQMKRNAFDHLRVFAVRSRGD